MEHRNSPTSNASYGSFSFEAPRSPSHQQHHGSSSRRSASYRTHSPGSKNRRSPTHALGPGGSSNRGPNSPSATSPSFIHPAHAAMATGRYRTKTPGNVRLPNVKTLPPSRHILQVQTGNTPGSPHREYRSSPSPVSPKPKQPHSPSHNSPSGSPSSKQVWGSKQSSHSPSSPSAHRSRDDHHGKETTRRTARTGRDNKPPPTPGPNEMPFRPPTRESAGRVHGDGKVSYGVRSVGGAYGPYLPKQNQDQYFVFDDKERKGDFFIGVMDGHGVKGEVASAFVKDRLVKNFVKQRDKPVPNAMQRAFVQTNEEMAKSMPIDVRDSGTTCVSAMRKGQDLWLANCGDSRAVMGRVDSSGKIRAHELTSDHKPDRQDEMERILKSNGTVEPARAMNGQFLGPPRVWSKRQQEGGLSMSRSLGDHALKRAGVIPVPEVKCEKIAPQDKFLVLASDGVWDRLPNQAVVSLAAQYDDPREASDAIVKAAAQKWAVEGQGYRDDITAVVVHLDSQGQQKATSRSRREK